jgi:hypothetical protein
VDAYAFLAVGGAGFGETFGDAFLAEDVHVAEDAANLLRDGFAGGFVDVEDGDADAGSGERLRAGLAEAGCASGDDGRDCVVEAHGFLLAAQRDMSISALACCVGRST